jgi:hypothetical protein
MNTQHFVSDLNERFFNGDLSPAFQEKLQELPIDRPDVFAFVERIFRYMHEAGIPAKDMSLLLGEILGTLLARILPGAWEGRVPPITVPGRHISMDQYLKNNPWLGEGNKHMLDIGCGFPPHTTLDTVKAFPDWNITGADPSLPVYVVHDEHGSYATLDENKSTVYFQPAIPTVENWNELLNDAPATKARFEGLLEDLINQPTGAPDSLPRLEKDPIKAFETDKLKFLYGGIGQVDVEPMDVIRCFNVLFYFDDSFYEKALDWFGKNLKEKGILITGGNWAVSTESYYNIYQKVGEKLENKEFAFGIDCVCPMGIAAWYANYDDDRQTAELMKYVRILRDDKSFMGEFYNFHDAQRLKHGLCPRDADGYYGAIDASIQPQDMWGLAGQVVTEMNNAGINQKAVDVLIRTGLNARVNEVGHVAICF